MTDRREFLRLLSILSVSPFPFAQAMMQAANSPGPAHPSASSSHVKSFPVTVQLSPLPGQPAWKGLSARADAKAIVRATIDECIQHGFTGLQYPFHLGDVLEEFIFEYARSRGMFLTYNQTFAKGGVEIFNRDNPPAISVYAPGYLDAVRQKLAPALAEAKRLPDLYNLFCYQDEPFHARPESFDYSAPAKEEFRKRFGYDMPAVEPARNSPKQWLDLLNFQSDTFPQGWRQIYKLVKQALPDVKVILTHDSHSALGAGVDSNEKIAVDDVYHWGADFADTIVFDIYPYMMFDFRYGELGKIRKPRLSQFHFAFAQLRNLTYSYGKQLGFWFGTYNREWFKDFMGPELQGQSWAEAEICHTAVAQGADFLISGYKIPEDKEHWDILGKSLSVLQQTPELPACPKVKAQACFLFPRTQYLQLQQEYWNVAVGYETFLQAFGELDCLHEEQVANGGLDAYRVLVIFDVQLLPEPVARKIADFVNAGGVVIADCVPRLDAYRSPMTILQELFGAEASQPSRVPRSGVWVPKLEKPRWFIKPAPGVDEDVVAGEIIDGSAFGKQFYFRAISPRPARVLNADVVLGGASGTPALLHRACGKGHAYLLGFSMRDTCFATWKDEDPASRASLQELLWAITQQAKVKPRIRSSNPEIEASLRANATDAYVLVINHEADHPNASISVAQPGFAFTALHNLTEKQNVEFHRSHDDIVFEIEVPRDRPQLLRFLSGKES